MCNCIEEIGKANSEKFPDLQINTRMVVQFNNPDSDMIEVPEITGTYAYKGKRKRVPIFPTFCPFCGEKYRKS